ncbi:MAG: hypothetical protein ACXW30_05070 [Micavibrio sp.]
MTTDQQGPLQKSFLTVNTLFWAVLVVALLPWLYFRSQQATNSDILWLCEVLQRLLDGSKLSDAAYETNPPLSALIYILPVLAKSFLHIPLHYAVFFQTVALTAFSALASYKIMRAWTFLSAQDVNIITAGYIFGTTIVSSIYIGERDHLIILGLMPFVLAQLTLTFNWPQAKGWIKPVFIAGAVFILLKPHHGLLPTLLLAHRMIVQRRLSVIFDFDFLSLALATLAYIGMVFLVFPDYVSVILPDVVHLYLSMGDWNSVRKAAIIIILFCEALLILAFMLKMPVKKMAFALFLIFSALISLIPYAVQGMGFYYHLIPALSFVTASIGFVLLYWIKKQTGRESITIFLSLIMLAGMAYTFAPLNIGYTRHQDYAAFPLSKTLAACKAEKEDCSFFMFNKEMGIFHETSYYTNVPHDSRFPSLWFLGELIRQQIKIGNGENSHLSKEEAERYFKKFADMIAKDLNRGKPELAYIWQWDDAEFYPGGFIQYFSTDENFSAAWKPYKKTGTLELNYADYYKGTNAQDKKIFYDIYRRTSP